MKTALTLNKMRQVKQAMSRFFKVVFILFFVSLSSSKAGVTTQPVDKADDIANLLKKGDYAAAIQLADTLEGIHSEAKKAFFRMISYQLAKDPIHAAKERSTLLAMDWNDGGGYKTEARKMNRPNGGVGDIDLAKYLNGVGEVKIYVTSRQLTSKTLQFFPLIMSRSEGGEIMNFMAEWVSTSPVKPHTSASLLPIGKYAIRDANGGDLGEIYIKPWQLNEITVSADVVLPVVFIAPTQNEYLNSGVVRCEWTYDLGINQHFKWELDRLEKDRQVIILGPVEVGQHKRAEINMVDNGVALQSGDYSIMIWVCEPKKSNENKNDASAESKRGWFINFKYERKE